MLIKNQVIIKNSIFLFTRTFIVSLIGLYTVRELLHILGSENYGLFNLIFGMVLLFTFANNALVVSTQRYLGEKIGENNSEGVRSVFLASFLIHLFLGILTSIIAVIFKDFFLKRLLEVSDYSYQANILYDFAVISIFISILQSPFMALITSFEKMKFFAYLGVFEGVSKLLIVFLLYFLPSDKLLFYAFLVCFISFFVLLLNIIYCYVEFKKIIFYRFLDLKLIFFEAKGMMSFISWTLMGNFAWMFRIQGNNILLNMFFGVTSNAAFAISTNIVNMINGLLMSVTNAIKPQIFKSYSEKDFERFEYLIFNGTRFFILGLISIVIPLMLLVNEIIDLWLRDRPKYVVDFLFISLLVLLFDSCSTYLTIAIQAIGKIIRYQIVLATTILLSIPITYFLFYLKFPINSFLYTLLFISFISFLIRLFFLKTLINFNILGFFAKVIAPCLFSGGILFFVCKLIYLGVGFYFGKSVLIIFINYFLMLVSSFVFIYYFGLVKSERNYIVEFIKKYFLN